MLLLRGGRFARLLTSTPSLSLALAPRIPRRLPSLVPPPPLRPLSSAPTSPPSPADGDVPQLAETPPAHPLLAYAELSKARLSSLVVLTSGAGFLLAGSPVDWAACAAAVTGTTLAAAAANTFNQVYESRTDALMRRTMRRPLPSGRLSRVQALGFGLACSGASAAVLLVGANPLAAALALGNVALYACVYTPLKQVSMFNTHVGALVGAVPPLIGWAAATGSLGAVEPFLLAYTLFAWQFPHFYALAWTLRKDYARGGHVMVPVVDATGGRWTAAQALRHAALLALVPPAAAVLGVASPMFAVEGVLLNGYFLLLARRFARDPSDATARALFRGSLWYLPVFLFLIVFHATSWHHDHNKAPLQRGSSVGAAVEHALATARTAGRAACAHVLFVDSLVGAGSTARMLALFETPILVAGADPAGAAAAPAAPATPVAAAPVASLALPAPPAPEPAAAAAVLAQAQAQTHAVEAVRGGAALCPVVVGSQVGTRAAAAVAAVAAASQAGDAAELSQR